MGRRRSTKKDINKGTWSKEEDEILFNYVTLHGEGKWGEVSKSSGLKRCAKSCRYRYLNYLKPDIKRGDISEEEQDLIIRLHRQYGNRWSQIAKKIPGRTDIEIKNYWKIYLSKILHHGHKLKNGKSRILEDNIIIESSWDIQKEDEDLSKKIQQIEESKNNDEKVGRHRLKGAWSRKEDEILLNYVAVHGEGQWEKVAQRTGLKRCGKSCRHRYLHYLRPGIKRGNISENEEEIIIKLHRLHGNRWTLIANNLPGRTDSEIKNYWHAYLSKKLQAQHEESSSSSSVNKSHHHKDEARRIEQINSVYASAQVPSPTKTNKNEIILPSESDHNTDALSSNSFQIEYDKAFLDDFLMSVYQNDQFGDGFNFKIPQFEDNDDMVISSFSVDHQCQLFEDDLDFWSSSEFPLFD